MALFSFKDTTALRFSYPILSVVGVKKIALQRFSYLQNKIKDNNGCSFVQLTPNFSFDDLNFALSSSASR